MSDKSFGDHLNRNIVKNPLLSTAVTGLSIEDLTHNAVLLPAAPSQELITSHGPQSGLQIDTLASADRKNDNHPSGDANSNILHLHHTPPSNLSASNAQHNRENVPKPNTTLSKALPKSDDDFDVNEYFARLQGTRYVSAPLNSLLKEDEKSNLEATEENLEEINLNEPDKLQDADVQQSLTADIAQNLSQLPTVLPQVASAVFSSFSNMLNMKSREQTPGVAVAKPVCQEMEFAKPENVGVPLMGVDEPLPPKEVAPPPTEPPISGTTSYRIATKKKAYAQIPGLSSTNVPPYNPVLNSAHVNISSNNATNFAPQQSQTNFSEISDKIDSTSNFIPTQSNLTVQQHTIIASDQPDVKMSGYKQEYNLFTPRVPDNTQVGNVETARECNIFDPATEEPQVLKDINVSEDGPPSLFTTVEQNLAQQTHNAGNTSIIPPPPMFSNVLNKNSQTNVKSVLPPSVARRIGSHHPIVKPQTLPPTMVLKDNIFVPAPLSDQAPKEIVTESLNMPFPEEAPLQSFVNSNSKATLGSAFVNFNATLPTTERNKALYAQESISTSYSVPVCGSSAISAALTVPASPKIQSKSESETTIAASNTFLQSVPQLPLCFTPSNATVPLMEPAATLSSQNVASNVTQLSPFQTLFNTNSSTQNSQSITDPRFDISSHSFNQNTSEISKPVSEPPKLVGNLNYRMQKKRPQYYSGPIEGVGAISNNVKPTIPTLEPSAFQGSLFTPDVKEVADAQSVMNTATAVIAQQAITPTPYPQFDISTPQHHTFIESNNTAFDMSRKTTDDYEMPKQESKGFGIIGSLKSKLSSLDINKIQNTVTTFFDPAYNDTKKEELNTQAHFMYDDNNLSYDYSQNQDSSLDVFVPNLEQSDNAYNKKFGHQHPYDYGQGSQHFQNQSYDLGNQTNTYLTHSYTGHNQSIFTTHNYENSTTDFYHPAHTYTQAPPAEPDVKTVTQGIVNKPEVQSTPIPTMPDTSDEIISRTVCQGVIGSSDRLDKLKISNSKGQLMGKHSDKTEHFESVPSETKEIGAFVVSQQLFNLSQPINTGDLNRKMENLKVAQEKEVNVSPDRKVLPENVVTGIFSNISDISTGIGLQSTTVSGNFFANFPSQNSENSDHLQNRFFDSNQSDADIGGFGSSYFQSGNDYKDVLKKEDSNQDIPCIDSTAMPLFGLPNILTDESDSIVNMTGDMKRMSLFGAIEKPVFDSNLDEMIKDDEPIANDEDITSELNICETCREVNVPEDKEADDLTSQLIENVTAPIQLLNPVIAPLTESSTNEEDSSFEPNQCAEISHITEETIETIQVQSATELLDDNDDENQQKTAGSINYGWNTTKNVLFNPPEVPSDQEYNFQIDPNAIGFFSNNSLFFEDMPNNASDEIKAEFKNTHDDAPLFVPRQISIPTAPPAEDDDSKSDETGGLDVHSIEQDAKMDFPIYEEFVIEPSETDDDKIEYREREKSTEDSTQNVDTFTNRIERFKKMEETVDKYDDIFSIQKSKLFDMNSATSPAIPLASYFDTGNYAADTHYRNSISSPSSIFNVGSPNDPLRIPPGFEEEYKRRMSVLSSRSHDRKSDKDENIPYIPDTSTQTRPVSTTIYSMVSNMPKDITVISKMQLIMGNKELIAADTSNLNPSVQEVTALQEQIHPPDVSSIFCQKPESGDNLVSSLFTNVEKEPVRPCASKTEDKAEPDKINTLADPISFFSSEDEPLNIAADNNFNRLASYFTSPAKTDHGKSFFELSQSQNHYRHANTVPSMSSTDIQISNTQMYEDVAASKEDFQNIPEDLYLNNLKLISDLTSSRNLTLNPIDPIVRTVNYFTVEYDNDELKNGFNIGEPDLKKVDKCKLDIPKDDCNLKDSALCDDKRIMMVVSKCKYCCNNDLFRSVKRIDTEFKVRKAMDSDSNKTDNRADNRTGMDQTSEDRAREVAVTFEHPLREENDAVSTTVESRASAVYTPVKHHWFYRVEIEDKSIWRGFSATDNRALEEAYASPDLNEHTVVATDGGRFDVNIVSRLRKAVYWTDKPTDVLRCSWFFKGTTDARYVPYAEDVAEKLEEEYRRGITTGQWHRRLLLPGGLAVVMHGPCVMVQLCQTDPPTPFAFNKRVYRNPLKIRVTRDQPEIVDHLLLLVHGAGEYHNQKEKEKFESTARPHVVRRGCEESEVEDSEPSRVDHLLLLCHGVGSACDMRFRSVQEVVDDFRATSLQLLQGHYRNAYDKGIVNRVEVLPISWHASLHSGETGVDRRLAAITLDSIPRLRSFTNDTVLDVLFYTSPVFCQTIIDTVCAELNRIYRLFVSRTPSFNGRVSLGGHSLGSVILYDLLCHQTPDGEVEMKSYVEGSAGTGQGAVRFPALAFQPAALYALGSPIAMFECIRGVKSLGTGFKLPTCQNFFNIFHPYDPIAYRIEPLIDAQLGSVKPFLIPHHKGRKRMHLELKDTMARVGADLKQKLLESLKSTWSSMWKSQPPHDTQLEKVVEEEIEKEQLCSENRDDAAQNEIRATPELLGSLNGGRRVDYVLQETPLEMINEYLFAMSSHVCYWESEDTMLLILREIYDSLGVAPDSTVPQQSLTVQRQRPARSNETYVINTSEYPSTSRDGT